MRAKPSAVSRQPSGAQPQLPIPAPIPQPPASRAFTLVEMLVAMAITLVMMAAVVTLFANVSNSVRNRRATTEMTGVLRHVRNTLQQDLQGATCPGVTWQRPESNHGYIELIEGIQSDQNPTWYVRDLNGDGILQPSESLLDPRLSPIPRNNIGADGILDGITDGKITPQELEAHYKTAGSFVPGALGDHDDVIKLTVRNEQQPFVGRAPTNVRNGNSAQRFDVDDINTPAWGYQSIESTLAEVIWFSVENPSASENDAAGKFFGEPGVRTIYRRALLIAPWLNPYSRVDGNGQEIPFDHDGGNFKAEPGLLRILPSQVAMQNVAEAIAALVAFQDRYDLSARLEWDHDIQRWKIMANTLADLTKRENRFGNFGMLANSLTRVYPYPFISTGQGYSGGTVDVAFAKDKELEPSDPGSAQWDAIPNSSAGGVITAYTVRDSTNLGTGFRARPFAYLADPPDTGNSAATANAVLNDQGQVVRVTFGPTPLWGPRRGQDVMMTDVLGFDLRVFDPGAPLYGWRQDPTSLVVLQPSDPGWLGAYNQNLGVANSVPPNTYEFMGQGAYVDMGYGYLPFSRPPYSAGLLPVPLPVPSTKSWTYPWFFQPRGLSDTNGNPLAPGYSVYDTWSFHYENNGVNEDGDSNVAGQPLIDEGVNGFDDPDPRGGGNATLIDDPRDVPVLGADDVGEYETTPPYDKPLRGIQVLIRAYEPDSRAIRQVRVNQHFLPE